MGEFDSTLDDVLRILDRIETAIGCSNFYLESFYRRQVDAERKERAVEEAIINLKQGVNAIPEA